MDVSLLIIPNDGLVIVAGLVGLDIDAQRAVDFEL